MIDLLRRNPLLLALALAAALLAVVLVAELRLAPPAPRDATARGARPVDAKLMPPVAARPPEQAYPEVTARPLFISTRRPAPEAAATPTASMPRGKFVLQGVIIHGEQRTALLRERATGRVHRADAGREIDGMKVVQIEREAVTLGMGDEREVVPLIVQKGAAGAPTVVAAPAPGGAQGGAAMAASAGAGPFARSNASLPAGAPGAPATPAGVAQAPTMIQGAPGAPAAGGPPFGPPTNTPNQTVPGTPPAQAAPTAGPAFPMSPEELLARRRARRAQQNQ